MTSVATNASRPDPELRTRRFLADEPVIWLSTVREDGMPHLVPVWFWWDGQTVLVFSKPNAVKVRALRANPRAMIALGEPDDDFDVAMVEAQADLLDETPVVPDAFFTKYADKLAAGRLDRDDVPRDLYAGDPVHADALAGVARTLTATPGARAVGDARRGGHRDRPSHATDVPARAGPPHGDVREAPARDRLTALRQRRRFRSARTSRAAFRPGAPVTPPPGCAPDPARYSPSSGIR